jgi:dTDP-4-dehydrorhamnose 3,5-epimerase
MSELVVKTTPIPGLLEIDLDVRSDSRGWFKESFQSRKLGEAGISGFDPVQNNISYNATKGVTRGIHAEPWDKYVSLACGSAFVAIVDMRAGNDFGRVFTQVLDTSKALLIPRGCGNSFQTLEDGVAYTYLVNAYWSPESKYLGVNCFDPQLGIEWPLGSESALISDKDRDLPGIGDISPVDFR